MPRGGFIRQLRERRFWRVLIAYPVVVFGLLEALEFFIDNYGVDPRWLTAALIASVLLLPAALLWNWRHGESGQQPVARGEILAYVASLAVTVVVVTAWFRQAPVPAAPAVAQPSAVQAAAAVASIAVMPLANVVGDAEVQYLCDGIAESLTNWLSRRGGVRVASKTAAFRFRDETDSARIADALDVQALLRGRLERVGGQWVASMALVDARDESQLWGDRVVQDGDDILALERTIAGAIQQGLAMQVFEDDEPVTLGGTASPEAYEHYLRGHFLIQNTEGEALNEGLEELRAAIAIDPGFALPYADIADALAQKLIYGQDRDERLVGEAHTAGYTATALAPELSEAWTAVATLAQFIDLDWAAADAAFEKAVALGPTGPVTYTRYAEYLVVTGRHDRALEMAQAALDMDPLGSSAMHAVGIVQLIDGEFDAAADILGQWNRYVPGSSWSYVKYALALALAGDCERAGERAAVVEGRLGDDPAPLMESWLAWGYHLCGAGDAYAAKKARIEAWEAAHPDRIDAGPVYLAAIEGDVDRVVDLIERAIEARDPLTSYVAVFAHDHLGWGISGRMAGNPRYRALLDSLNLPAPDPDQALPPE